MMNSSGIEIHASAHAEYDLAERVAFLDPLMRGRGVVERERLGNHDAELRPVDGPGEPLELAHAGDGVVRGDLDALAFTRRRLDPVRVRDAAATRLEGVEALREGRAGTQGKDGVRAVGRELAGGLPDVTLPPVSGRVGAEPPDQGHAVLTRGGCEYARAEPLRELQRDRPDAARRAVDDQPLTLLDLQRTFEALESREPRDRDRTGFAQSQCARHRRDVLRVNGDVLRVEAAFRVHPAIRVDLVARLESAHARTDGDDGSRSI